MQWLEFESLVNARDVGGIPTVDGGTIRSGRLLRSDNLQALTPADIQHLRQLGLTDVIDLRTAFEVHHEGNGPLVGAPGIHFHHYSFIKEQYGNDQETLEQAVPDNTEAVPAATLAAALPSAAPAEAPGKQLPFIGRTFAKVTADPMASHYLAYLTERPESVLGALRAVANANGAALVHCAAGKDRTGTTVALSLLLVGAEPDAVVADYAASSERIDRIIQRLIGTETYSNLKDRPLSSHRTEPESMRQFIHYADNEYGGVAGMLGRIGWTEADTDRMRARLLG
ncbi:tyrosine-protein phosphatase [Granulicoccus phenolivorans]|uniref:tyrosine-protein phosphatase n=1 Tax=Granulicoccus phenolivorans TaxID=266854 RepID=UPI00047DC92E|nr:tyrosine-protein phosphatase [Granulicoccus phenolivorans]